MAMRIQLAANPHVQIYLALYVLPPTLFSYPVEPPALSLSLSTQVIPQRLSIDLSSYSFSVFTRRMEKRASPSLGNNAGIGMGDSAVGVPLLILHLQRHFTSYRQLYSGGSKLE
jgi:hypothetical protein